MAYEQYPIPGRDIWPYTCEICDVSFAYKEDYNKHMKIHKELGHSQRTLAESLNPSEKKVIPSEYVKYGFRIENTIQR
ncbi:hypothetical protein GF312_13785 [Candidatus Poribacteria bacterium]|nr:hypothetical protein [Candidatus Poribacteria bacterium]